MDSSGELHDGTYELKLGRSIFQRADPEYVLMSFQSHDPITEDGSSTLIPNRNGYSASFKYGDKDTTYEMEDSESTDQVEALIVYDEATKTYRLELPSQRLSVKDKARESDAGNRTRKKKREDGKQSRRQSVDDDFSKDIESQLMEVLDNDDDDDDEEEDEENGVDDESDRTSDARPAQQPRQPPKPAKPPKKAKTPPPAKPAISSPALALPTRPTSSSPVQRRNIPMASRPIRRPDSPPPPPPPAAPRTGGKRPQQYGGKTVLRRPPGSPHSRRRSSTSSTDSSSGSSSSGSSGSSSGSSSSGSGSSSEDDDDDDDDDDDMDDLEADIAESLSTPTESINGKPSTGGKSIAAAAAQHHQQQRQQQQQPASGPRSLRALFSDEGDEGDEDEGMTSSSDSD